MSENIPYFLTFAKHKIEVIKFYYPIIIKGLLEISLARFSEAEVTLMDLLSSNKIDENIYGVLGYLYYRQKRFDDAEQYYRKALNICPKDKNKEIKFNLLTVMLESGKIINDIKFLDDFNIDTLEKEDKIRYLNLKAVAYYRTGKLKESEEIFKKLFNDNLFNDVSAVYYSLLLRDKREIHKSINMLEKINIKLNDTNIYHHIANMYISVENYDNALNIYKNVLCSATRRKRQYLVDYARILKFRNRLSEMRSVCDIILDKKIFGNPVTDEDYFYNGFANYLLGKTERARYDFERSDNLFGKYYDEY